MKANRTGRKRLISPWRSRPDALPPPGGGGQAGGRAWVPGGCGPLGPASPSAEAIPGPGASLSCSPGPGQELLGSQVLRVKAHAENPPELLITAPHRQPWGALRPPGVSQV